MKLILATLLLASILGLALGGRLSALASLRVRWTPVALAGLALQLAPVPGKTWPMVFLFASFALLLAFSVVNLRARVPGFTLILLGVVLNLAVISVDRGMPVSREALVASHQEETLPVLLNGAGAKHHLAGSGDRLMFLADVIAVPPLDQVVSLGDVFAYAGAMWLVVAGMRRRETGTRVAAAAGVASAAAGVASPTTGAGGTA